MRCVDGVAAPGQHWQAGRSRRPRVSQLTVRAYAEVVRDRAVARALASFADEVTRSVADRRGRTADELIGEATSRLLELQSGARTSRGLVAAPDLARDLVDDLDRRQGDRGGLNTGLSDFDAITTSLEPGDLVVAAARPGMGKTALMVTIADYTSGQGKPTAVFSAEMPARQLMRRHVARHSGIPQSLLRRSDKLTDTDWASITPALGDLAKRPLWIDDTALPSLAHIRSECYALKARSGLALVMVDYVQLVSGEGGNRYEQLRDVAYGLKALAKDLCVPVIVLAQLNRGVESREQKRPFMSDLRDSGAIEEAADIVGLLYREAYYNPEFGMPYVLEFNIEKNRNGDRGECLWRFAGEHSRITVLEPGARAQYLQLRAKGRRAGGVDVDL
jgi:replicative DNA helicase